MMPPEISNEDRILCNLSFYVAQIVCKIELNYDSEGILNSHAFGSIERFVNV